MLSNVWSNGCLFPITCFFPGKVISITSLASLAFFSFSFILLPTSSSLASTSFLAIFTNLPTTGLSSGDKEPIPLNIVVSSPFFPKYLTLISSKAALFSAEAISLSAASLIAVNFSSMILLPSF